MSLLKLFSTEYCYHLEWFYCRLFWLQNHMIFTTGLWSIEAFYAVHHHFYQNSSMISDHYVQQGHTSSFKTCYFYTLRQKETTWSTVRFSNIRHPL